MLAGLAQVLPKNVWQYVVQIPRLASLGRKFVLQGGTQYNLAAVKAQVDYIKERVPDAEVFVHPHTGEAGAIGAAMETLRVVKRKGKSTLHRHRCGDRPRVHDEERRRDGLSLLSERVQAHVHRHEAPGRLAPAATSPASPARRAPSRAKEAMLALVADRKKIAQAVPEHGRLRGEARVPHFYEPAPMPDDGSPIKDIEVKQGHPRHQRRVEITRPFKRSSQGGAGEAPPHAHRHPARAQHLLDGAVLPDVLRGARHPEAERRLLATRPPRRCGSRAASTARSTRASRRKVAQAHVHNLLFHQHTDEEAAQVHLLPHPHARAELRRRHDGQRVLPDRRRRARRHEGRVHEGGRLLRARAASSTSIRRSRSSSRTLTARRMFETWGPRLGITEDENDHACREAWKALDHLRERRPGQGPRHPRDRRGRGPRRDPDDRPPVPLGSGPEPRHPRGVPGARLSDPVACARSRRTASTSIATSRKSSTSGTIKSPARAQPRVAGELLGQQRAEGVGARRSRRTTRTSSCSISRASSAATTRRPTASSTRSSSESKTPYAALHDIDANKPGGSIKIRVKTYAHALKLHEERLEDVAQAASATARARHRQEAPRAPRAQGEADRATRRMHGSRAASRRSRSSARSSQAYVAPPDARWSPSRPKGIVQLGKKTQGRRRSFASRSRRQRCKPAPLSEPGETMSNARRPTVTTQRRRSSRIAGAEHRHRGRAEARSRRRSASASASTTTSSSGSRTWSASASRRRERAERHAAHRRPDRSRRTTSSRAPSRASATTCRCSDCPTTEGFQTGKEFGNRGQCNPTYFTVGNLVKYLIDLRDKHGMTAEGDRREVRLPHRRRVRPVPLRHVRHRVPQGAPRRRLRRLPRHALPADRRPQAGDGRRGRPRDEPARSSWAIVKGIVARRRDQRASATASAPTRSVPGATNEALEKAKKIVYDALSRPARTSSRRSGSRKPILAAVEGRRTLAQAEGQHHRRVLGDDHRGRRQLPAPDVPRERGRRVRHPARRRRGSSTTSGRSTHDTKEREDLRGDRHREVRPRRRSARSAVGQALAIGVRAASSRVRALFQTLRARGGPLRLPPAGHEQDRRDQRTSTTTTISAAAKATWRSAS